MGIRVCIGEYCHLQGAEEVVKAFKLLLEKEGLSSDIQLTGCFCMRKCEESGVSVQIGEQKYKTEYEAAEDFFYKTVLPAVKKA